MQSAMKRLRVTQNKDGMNAIIKKEMKKQVLEWGRKRNIDIYSNILWSAHKQLGLGHDRLIKFFNGFIDNWEKFTEDYDFDDTYAEQVKLKEECGIDVEELMNERKMLQKGKIVRDKND